MSHKIIRLKVLLCSWNYLKNALCSGILSEGNDPGEGLFASVSIICLAAPPRFCAVSLGSTFAIGIVLFSQCLTSSCRFSQ
jgi:hypothetical protein